MRCADGPRNSLRAQARAAGAGAHPWQMSLAWSQTSASSSEVITSRTAASGRPPCCRTCSSRSPPVHISRKMSSNGPYRARPRYPMTCLWACARSSAATSPSSWRVAHALSLRVSISFTAAVVPSEATAAYTEAKPPWPSNLPSSRHASPPAWTSPTPLARCSAELLIQRNRSLSSRCSQIDCKREASHAR